MIGSALAAMARVIGGATVRCVGCRPHTRPRVYFANHTSHFDVLVLWSALPGHVRALTRPVAARDYWDSGTLRRYFSTRVFNAVLVERRHIEGQRNDAIQLLLAALGERYSLILFPEGTRGTGETVAPFKSGLYNLAVRRPDLELVPVYLENLNRILPKGELLPVPLLSAVTFGPPIHVLDGEAREAFLERAREAVLRLRPGTGSG